MAGTVKGKLLRLLPLYGYSYSALLLIAWWLNHAGMIRFPVPTLALWLIILIVLYQALGFGFVERRFGRRMAHIVSIGLLSTMMIIVNLMTGGYGSIDNAALLLLVFLSAMLGPTLPLTLFWFYVLGYILALNHVIPVLDNSASDSIGAMMTLAYAAAALGGWLAFGRLYVRQDPRILDLQRALMAERLQSSEVIAAINDGVAIIGNDGVTRHANDRFLEIMDITKQELVGRHYNNVVTNRVKIIYSSSKTPRIGFNIANVLRTGESVQIDIETVEYLNGKPPKDYSISISPLKNEDNEVSAVLVICHDITGLMRLQRMKDDFVATASHELRTPATVISGYTDLMLKLDVKDKEKLHHYIERTKDAALLLTHLVNDMLDISQLTSGRRANRPEKIALAPYLKEVADEYKSHYAEKDLALTINSEPMDVFVDKSRLGRLLESLLTNAYKFTPEHGKVSIETTQDKQGATTVSVIDDGPSIPDDQQEQIFDTFNKLDKTGSIAGTGLGLAIAKKIVEDWGGAIKVKNIEGGGVCFYFTIPPAVEDK